MGVEGVIYSLSQLAIHKSNRREGCGRQYGWCTIIFDLQFSLCEARFTKWLKESVPMILQRGLQGIAMCSFSRRVYKRWFLFQSIPFFFSKDALKRKSSQQTSPEVQNLRLMRVDSDSTASGGGFSVLDCNSCCLMSHSNFVTMVST
jgi:hypothetical protein